MPKTICVVSNKPEYTKDYSDLVNSADVVIRVNRMNSLENNQTGTKTDIACVWVNRTYITYNKEQRKVDVLKNCDKVYVVGSTADINWMIKEDGITPIAYPHALCSRTCVCPHKFSGYAKTIALARHFYPNDKLYILGDADCVKATGFNDWCLWSDEDTYINTLVRCKKAELLQ